MKLFKLNSLPLKKNVFITEKIILSKWTAQIEIQVLILKKYVT